MIDLKAGANGAVKSGLTARATATGLYNEWDITMKRLYTLLLVCSMLIACRAPVEQACAAAGTLLPDVEAELYGESEEDTGPCHTYTYEAGMTLNEAAAAIVDRSSQRAWIRVQEHQQ